jgi:hypothetical protein
MPAPTSAGPAEPRRTKPIVERIASLSPVAALDGPAAVAPGQPPTLSINVKVAALIAEATLKCDQSRAHAACRPAGRYFTPPPFLLLALEFGDFVDEVDGRVIDLRRVRGSPCRGSRIVAVACLSAEQRATRSLRECASVPEHLALAAVVAAC